MAFTLYPEGYVPYARAPAVSEAAEGDGVDTRSSLLGAAVAASRGVRWPEDLDRDVGETGPVQRTQRRRVERVGWAVGLDQPVVSSAVLGELGLDAAQCSGPLATRLAVLARRPAEAGLWLRIVGAIDLVGKYGPVGVIVSPGQRRLAPARGAFARAMRGPPGMLVA